MSIIKFIIIVFPSLLFLDCCAPDDSYYELVIQDYSDELYYESEILNDEFKSLYGKWEIVSISGGFSGMGYEPNFDYLEFKEFGIYAFVRADSILEFGKIQIEEQSEEKLLINFIPDPAQDDLFFSDPEKYIEFDTNNLLNLNSPCCDRFNYHFKRVE